MTEKIKKKRQLILNALNQAGRPVSSEAITRHLESMGQEISQRTVRFYLKGLDQEGFTQNIGKRGRMITKLGKRELDASRSIERIGFLSAKIDQMTYRMSFDLNKRSGTVVINLAMVEVEQLLRSIDLVCGVFSKGYSMGCLATLLKPGEKAGHISVPEGMIGVGTVCSITLNSVLLKHGISTYSRFGGLLEIKGGRPVRFVEIINYDGTTVDPLEVFIRSGMTTCAGASTGDEIRIGASFREFPADSRQLVTELAQKLKKAGLGGFLEIGWPGLPLLDIPVSEGRVGAIVLGGLNPVAIFEESGVRVSSRALAGLINFKRLFHYKELDARLRALV